jgi:hypothetical protein
MERDTEVTRVVFRVWTRAKYQNGEVIALFPDIDEGNGECASYMHVGQHGGACYTYCIAQTRPARPEEYQALRTELESEPYKYNLRVVKRRPNRRR